MNINALTAILQELAYQSSNRTAPATRAENVAQVHDLIITAQKMVEAAGTSSTGLATQANIEQTTEQPFPILSFVPLPLRSELFPEARFFAGLGEDKTTAPAGQEMVEEIFICVVTEKLGQVWIGLACRNDFLSVKCFTEQEMSNKIIRENFPALRNDLKTIGFKEVSLTSRTRSELGAFAEAQLPKFEEHFLNRII